MIIRADILAAPECFCFCGISDRFIRATSLRQYIAYMNFFKKTVLKVSTLSISKRIKWELVLVIFKIPHGYYEAQKRSKVVVRVREDKNYIYVLFTTKLKNNISGSRCADQNLKSFTAYGTEGCFDLH